MNTLLLVLAALRLCIPMAEINNPDSASFFQSRLVTPSHAQSRDFKKKKIVYFFMNHFQKPPRLPFSIRPICLMPLASHLAAFQEYTVCRCN